MSDIAKCNGIIHDPEWLDGKTDCAYRDDCIRYTTPAGEHQVWFQATGDAMPCSEYIEDPDCGAVTRVVRNKDGSYKLTAFETLRELDQKASAAPWEQWKDTIEDGEGERIADYIERDYDNALIVTLRNSLPALLDRIEADGLHYILEPDTNSGLPAQAKKD